MADKEALGLSQNWTLALYRPGRNDRQLLRR